MRTRAEDVKGLGRVVRGTVSAAGGVVKGTGFTVTKTGTGTYVVTFLQPFKTVPVVTAVNSAGNGLIVSTSVTAGAVSVFTTIGATSTAADGAFDFVATEADLA